MPVVKYQPRRRPRRPNDLAPARPDSFFLVDLVSVSLRELVPHLEHPFFGLSKIPERGVRRYEDDKGQYLQLEPGTAGLPTIFDQDFVIYATSVLMAERRRLEENPHLKGERRVSEDGIVSFSAADFAEFTHRLPSGRKGGGKLYNQIETGLRRLAGTRLETNLAAGGYRRLDLFGMIDQASIVRREKLRPDDEGVLLGCRVRLSKWMMEAVNSNQILQLDRDYFRLRRPLDRRLYQIFRKHCGSREKWEISIPKLYAKSAAKVTVRNFRHSFREFVRRWDDRLEWEAEDFLGYRVEFDADRDVAVVRASEPKEPLTAGSLLRLPAEPSDEMMEIARGICPGYDPAIPYRAWLAFIHREGKAPVHPAAAFRGFCNRWAEQNPPLFAAAGLTEFPAGNIEYDPAWADLARAHCNWDLRLLGDTFRKFCRQKDIPLDHLNIARRFAGFCRNLPRK